ncbi:MAG TPA: hypothetical protein EYN66_06850 [Myxococcales bacterium]|nr:hypothetical protein [Myxococcales bacterium]
MAVIREGLPGGFDGFSWLLSGYTTIYFTRIVFGLTVLRVKKSARLHDRRRAAKKGGINA